MNKTMKGIVLTGLSAMMCVSFLGCDKDGGGKSASDLRLAVEKVYAAGYTKIYFTFNEDDLQYDGIIVTLEAENKQEKEIEAYLYESEDIAKVEAEANAIGTQYGKWVVTGDDEGVDAFCSSSQKTTGVSFDWVNVVENVYALDNIEYVEAVFGIKIENGDEDNFGEGLMAAFSGGTNETDIEGYYYESEAAAKDFYNNEVKPNTWEYDVSYQQGQWCFWSEGYENCPSAMSIEDMKAVLK